MRHFLALALVVLFLVAPAVYIFTNFDEWIYRVGVVPTRWDFVFSLMFVAAVMGFVQQFDNPKW